MLFSAIDINATRIVAVLRIAIAAICLLFAATDVEKLGLEPEFDDFAALIWLIACLAAALIAWSDWWRDAWLFPVILVIDYAAFDAIPFAIEPHSVAYLVAAPLIAALIVVETAFYRGWRWAFYSFLVLNLMCVMICLMHNIFGMPMPLGETIRRIVMLALVTALILWLCRGQFTIPVARFDAIAETDLEGALHVALRYASREIRAEAGLALWQPGDGSRPVTVAMGAIDARVGNGEALSRIRSLPTDGTSLLFDLSRGRALEIDPAGQIAPANAKVRGLNPLRDFGIHYGVAAPLVCDSGSGWFVLVGAQPFSRAALHYSQGLASEVSRGMDRFQGGQSARLLALARMRETVARDLHDGVAQSLAGTRYWLQSMRSHLVESDGTLAQFDQFVGALESEQRHVRDLIEHLRDEQHLKGRDLCDAVKALVARLAPQWSVEIGLDLPPVPVMVRSDLSFELLQIVREAVANAARHGKADRIKLAIKVSAKKLRVAISDNGSGFKPAKNVAIPRTIGERAKELGGEASVRSQKGSTLVEISLPVENVH